MLCWLQRTTVFMKQTKSVCERERCPKSAGLWKNSDRSGTAKKRGRKREGILKNMRMKNGRLCRPFTDILCYQHPQPKPLPHPPRPPQQKRSRIIKIQLSLPHPLLPLPKPLLPQQHNSKMIQIMELHPPSLQLHPPQFVAAKSLMLHPPNFSYTVSYEGTAEVLLKIKMKLCKMSQVIGDIKFCSLTNGGKNVQYDSNDME